MSNWHAWITDPEIRRLLQMHQNDDVAKLALLWSGRKDLPVQWMLQQLSGRQTAKVKLPEWHAVDTIVYPDKTALEQCSSSYTARYKQTFAEGKKVADLTGGLGVDSWSMASVAKELIYFEPDPLRFEIAQHNFQQLGVLNIRCYNTTAENSQEILRDFQPDLVYIDPSRRDTSKRFFRLEDLQPDITTLLPELQAMCDRVLLKAAPMLDIKLGIRQLLTVQEVHVVSWRNECRELLFYIGSQPQADPLIQCVEINGERKWEYEFRYSREELLTADTTSIGNFILDPFACITKAGGYKSLALDFELQMLHANTHLFTGESSPKGFPGRSFRVLEVLPYDIGLIRGSVPDKNAHLLFRNFPVKPDEVVNKLKFKSGGGFYLFFITDHAGKLRVVKSQPE